MPHWLAHGGELWASAVNILESMEGFFLYTKSMHTFVLYDSCCMQYRITFCSVISIACSSSHVSFFQNDLSLLNVLINPLKSEEYGQQRQSAFQMLFFSLIERHICISKTISLTINQHWFRKWLGGGEIARHFLRLNSPEQTSVTFYMKYQIFLENVVESFYHFVLVSNS